MSKRFEARRKKIIRQALQNPKPCLVCDSLVVVGVGTWVPDDKYRWAVGGNDKSMSIFAYWLCAEHTEQTKENEKVIQRLILNIVRTGNKNEI